MTVYSTITVSYEAAIFPELGASTWIHLYNYVEASKWGCAGGADFTDPSQVQEDQRDGFMF